MTHYLDNVAGSHEIGFGIYAAPWNRYPQFSVYNNATGWTAENHTPVDANGNIVTQDNLAQAVGTRWYYRTRPGDASGPASELKTRDARDRDIAFYLQDAWKPTDRLTLNLGVRADFVKRYDGILGIDRMDTLALGPRAGFSYMVTEDGRTVLRGNIGRVHEQMNGRDAVTSSHSGASIGSYREYDHDGDGVADFSRYTPPRTNLDPTFLFDPDIGQPFVNEAIVGVRRQFRGQFAMDVALVHRRYNDNYEYLEQNGYWPASSPAQPPLGEFQFGKVDIEQGTINQQTNNSWVDLVYTAIEITTTRRTERMSATLNINRQWQKYNGDWNPPRPGALHLAREVQQHEGPPHAARQPRLQHPADEFLLADLAPVVRARRLHLPAAVGHHRGRQLHRQRGPLVRTGARPACGQRPRGHPVRPG